MKQLFVNPHMYHIKTATSAKANASSQGEQTFTNILLGTEPLNNNNAGPMYDPVQP